MIHHSAHPTMVGQIVILLCELLTAVRGGQNKVKPWKKIIDAADN